VSLLQLDELVTLCRLLGLLITCAREIFIILFPTPCPAFASKTDAVVACLFEEPRAKVVERNQDLLKCTSHFSV
jgi:sulfatase maturation enzyme AslB (radical SAM superfamily)